MSKSQAYLDAIKNIDWNAFPDEIEANDIVYIQSEIGGVGNKLPSGENLGVYIPKDFDKCLELGSVKLTSEQAKALKA
jgi:hypothetical protein